MQIQCNKLKENILFNDDNIFSHIISFACVMIDVCGNVMRLMVIRVDFRLENGINQTEGKQSPIDAIIIALEGITIN